MRTVHTRLCLPEGAARVLDAVAGLSGRVERAYFRERHVRGRKVAEVKQEFLTRFSITARQFNGARFTVDAAAESAREAGKRHLESTRERLKVARAQEKKLRASLQTAQKKGTAKNGTAEKAPISRWKERQGKGQKGRQKERLRLHELSRKIHRLEETVERLKEEMKRPPRLTFGSGRLFRAQFHLAENGYQSHEEWKREWQRARSSSFFLLGSKDETAGNQTCQLMRQEEGRFLLQLRLPYALEAEHGKHLLLPVRFPHGEEALLQALASGTALSYRFLRKRKKHPKTGRPRGPEHWYLHVSFQEALSAVRTDERAGRLGVDINQDFLSLAHVDSSGNPVRCWDIPLRTTDRRHHQVKTAAQEAAKELVEYAAKHRLPLVLEKLDFQRKKNEMAKSGVRRRRQLSGFAYSTIQQAIRSRAAREGVEVGEVNPAFTSIIGEAKYARGYGLSRHRAAAVVIARRKQKQGEALRGRNLHLSPHQGYATSLPVRNREVHVWRDWGRFAAALKHLRLLKKAATGAANSRPDVSRWGDP